MKPTPTIEQCQAWGQVAADHEAAAFFASHEWLQRYAALAAEWGAAQQRETDAAICESVYPEWKEGAFVELPCFETAAECAAAIRNAPPC